MNRLRALIGLLTALLAMATGAGVWSAAHRGYPNAVYYQEDIVAQTTVTTPAAATRFDTWTDPVAERQLTRIHVGKTTSAQLQYRECLYLQPDAHSAWSADCHRLDPQVAGQFSDMRRSGFGAFVHLLLARRAGPIVRVQLDGRPALQFGFEDPPSSANQATVWLDPASHALLQWGHMTAQAGTSDVDRIIRQSLLAPNTLPADFFDPPSTDHNLWDRATGWVQDRLAGANPP